MKRRIIVASLALASVGCSTDIFVGLDSGDPGDAQGDAYGDAPSGDDGSTTGDAADGGASEPDGEGGSFDGALDVNPIDATSADAGDSGSDAAVTCSSVDVSACSHSPCVTGAALPSNCDSSGEGIVFDVCTFYVSSCCSTAWTSTCVSYAGLFEPKCNSCL